MYLCYHVRVLCLLRLPCLFSFPFAKSSIPLDLLYQLPSQLCLGSHIQSPIIVYLECYTYVLLFLQATPSLYTYLQLHFVLQYLSSMLCMVILLTSQFFMHACLPLPACLTQSMAIAHDHINSLPYIPVQSAMPTHSLSSLPCKPNCPNTH